MELGSSDFFFFLPGASFYYWINERMSGMASPSCPNSLIKRHGHFQGSLWDFFNHSGSLYLYFIIFNDDMREGRAFVQRWIFPSWILLPTTPHAHHQASCCALGLDLHRRLVKHKHQRAWVACPVTWMAISNHGNLPSQASVAPRA